MKQINFFVAALASLFLAGSCQQQENLEPAAKGTSVSFDVEVPGDMETKAVADGKNVDVLYYAIYKDGDGKESHENGVLNPNSTPLASGYIKRTDLKKFNITFDLLVDQEYVAIFWAQVGVDKKYYAWPENDDLRVIKYADSKGVIGNMEERAAFFRTYQFSTYQVADHDVTLYRPFAQLNLGSTLESLEPTQGGEETEYYVIDVLTSEVKVTGLAKSFNTIAGLGVDEYCGQAEAPSTDTYIFKMHEVITPGSIADVKEGEKDTREYLLVKNKEGKDIPYEYIAMNYFFANGNVTVEYDIVTDKGTVNNTVENVPVMENFRTNIIGNLLTSKTDFEIIVDERFNVPDENIYYDENDNVADYRVRNNTYEVYSAKGLIKWAYVANNIDNTVGLRLMRDIELPAYEIEADPDSRAYKFTDKSITITDGVPSGSNWVPVGWHINKDNTFMYRGAIEGNGKTITGLYINNGTNTYTGFIGITQAGTKQDDSTPDVAYIENLTIKDAVVYSKGSAVGALAGMIQNIKGVENCHVINSNVTGMGKYTGGLVGYSYSRETDNMVVIAECSVDEKSTVNGSDYTGGVVGDCYAGIVFHSTNASNVTGSNYVGGITGAIRDYQANRGGHIIGCGNSGNINAARFIGGITGQTFRDNAHTGSEAVVIACWSTSTSVSANSSKGLLVGISTNTELNIGSWAFKTANLSKVIGEGKTTACFAFDSEANQTAVEEMNAAIASYNTGREDKQSYCPYTWTLNENNIPVLVK